MTRALALAVAIAWLALCAACAQRQPAEQTSQPPTKTTESANADMRIVQTEPTDQIGHGKPPEPPFKDLFPHVRADLRAGVVEFDARVTPLLIPDPRAPLFYLEVLVCTPDSREHETLLVTDARPSHVHAALLAVGVQPGKPGGWRVVPRAQEAGAIGLSPVLPTGDPVSVRFILNAGSPNERIVDPLEWTVRASDVLADSATPRTLKSHLASTNGGPFHVFAGSTLTRRRPDQPETYDADGTGQLIGLHTFGSELIALSTVMSPDAEVETPDWVADLRPGVIPSPGTSVRVRISRP